MFGFLFGTLCLIGLIKVARHGRGYGGCGGYGYGRGYGGWGHRGHRGWHGRDHFGDEGYGGGWGERVRGYGGGRFFLRAMFERLDTTPGQEKVIQQAFEDLREKGRAAKNDMKAARAEVAKAMRSTSFDEVSVGTATAQVEAVMDSMRKAVIDAFAKVHEALDDRQRGMFADFIENGPRFRDFAGSWRDRGDHGNPGNHGGPYRYSV
jgi:Spy/CpxP family protein refolding chaperone